MSTTTQATAQRSLDLLYGLASAGFFFGSPSHVSKECQAIDAAMCHAMRCPGCNRPGMLYNPMHRGREYRAVASCKHCGAGEEV
jgi:hypothetical protein